jgi:hypothetical protein
MGLRFESALLGAALMLAGCGGQAAPDTATESGVRGRVLLGPQCPVETVRNPCHAQPAANVSVVVSKRLQRDADPAGNQVVRTRTDANGRFLLAVPPGSYTVTAEAGMSCDRIDALITAGPYLRVEVPCVTGIR